VENCRAKIVLLSTIDPSAREVLYGHGYEVCLIKPGASLSDWKQALRGAVALGIRSKNQVTGDLLEHAKDLLAVGAFGIGVDQIDLDACSCNGVAVFNDPISSAPSVVELVLGFILNLSRRASCHNRLMHRGRWIKTTQGAHEVKGKTLGIVGYGGIGSKLSEFAELLGMQVLFYDITDRVARGNAQRCLSLHELLGESDFVSLHIGGNKEIIGKRELEWMKDGAYIINTSRGSVLDQGALIQALQNRKLGGAALDVFAKEPTKSEDGFKSELQGLPNVIMTPHVAGSTEEAQERIGKFVANKLHLFLSEGSAEGSVNMPQTALDDRHSGYRITYIHRNVPGVVAKVSTILDKTGINIEDHKSKTLGEVGYWIIDTNKPCSDTVFSELANMPETIRVRELNRRVNQ
jgi:D-3-phosphoglycerate dehydrogenase / 2-oxoglutarate reductase